MEYQYRPLTSRRSFRKLILLPGKWDNPIKILLKEATLVDKRKPWEAISYVWGKSPDRYPIFCEDHVISVTLSLFEVLRRLRKESSSSVLWADAICINQNDDREKSMQVLLMREIYSQASNVVVWMGESDSSTAEAFEYLRLLEKRYYQRKENRESTAGHREASLPASFYQNGDKAARRILRHEWFGRIWTLQEIYVSYHAEVHCGAETISWRRFISGLIEHEALGSSMSEVRDIPKQLAMRLASYMARHASSLEARKAGRQMSNLLWHTRISEASDPRDRVYALLGMADMDDVAERLQPDYSKGFAEVMADAVRWVIQKENSLKILLFVDVVRPKTRDIGFPSWAPDLRAVQYKGLLDPNQFGSADSEKPLQYRFMHSKTFEPIIPIRSIPEELILRGMQVDQISAIVDLKSLYLSTRERHKGIETATRWKDLFLSLRAAFDNLTECFKQTSHQDIQLDNIAFLEMLCFELLPSRPKTWDGTIYKGQDVFLEHLTQAAHAMPFIRSENKWFAFKLSSPSSQQERPQSIDGGIR